MIHISKLADYGTLIMATLAKNPTGYTAREIAELTHVPLPTVSKLLKLLTRAGLLFSQRGINGGYVLAKSAAAISLAEIIYVLEGGVALTECSQRQGKCSMESVCMVRQPWRDINSIIRDALTKIHLNTMLR